jgi:regulator of sigma E protease
MGQLFSFLIVIGIIILIHEFGHFLMAKLFRIPVAAFSLGFGPRLFGFRMKETEYKISAIPLGGYVKIHGMEDQEATPDDPNSFYNRPRWQRFLVLFMGVGFNWLLAVILITIALTMGLHVSQSVDMPSVIGAITPDTPAEKAELQVGDRIISINGENTPTWEKVSLATLLHPDETIDVRIQREGQTIEKLIPVGRNPNNSLGYIGIHPATDVIVLDLTPNMPAAKFGLLKGDVIVSIDGIPIHAIEGAPAAVQHSAGKPVKVVVKRNQAGQWVTKEFVIPPVKDAAHNRWILGFAPGEPTKLRKLPFPAALKDSLRQCRDHVKLNMVFLSKLIQGKLSLKATSGPFDIARLSDATRQTGLSTFLLFIGQISFDIGIINLLPIPALDGGHIFFLLLEGIFRREISIKVKERVTMVGFVFLICVMVVVLYYDVQKTATVQKLLDSFR